MIPGSDGLDGFSLGHVSWDVSKIESYFNVVSPPSFDEAENAFVMVIEARKDGNCALAPSVPSFFGFEAILDDENRREIHVAHDIGSATGEASSADAYREPVAERICVVPPRWSAGDKIRLIIAPGLEPTILSRIRQAKISAI